MPARQPSRNRKRRRNACPVVERLEQRTLLAYTATLDPVNLTVTFTGDAAGDLFVLDLDTRGRLRHNRFDAGDPGFASSIDLDSTQGGVQSAAGGNGITVLAGAGDDTVSLGDTDTPISDFENVLTIIVEGDDGDDSLIIDDRANPEGTGLTDAVLTSQSFENGFINYGTFEHLLVQGGPGNDSIDVDSTADGTATTLKGGAGDDHADVLSTGVAGLTLDGETGNDSVKIEFGNLAGPVTVVDYGATFTGSDDSEFLVLTDTQITNGAQTVDLTNTTAAPTVSGGGGNDTIDASAATRPAALEGGAGDDLITGGSQGDTINGGDGDDQLTGGAGDDSFIFEDGWGTDTVEADGTADNDVMDFSAVTTDLTITLASVTVQDGAGNVAQHTGDRIETVRGGQGNDSAICTAATGKLMLQLLDGNDTVDCSLSPVGMILDGGAGDDTFMGTALDDVLIGGDGDDDLTGGDGNDTLVGGPGRDTLVDNSGDNSLVGGPGCDNTNGADDPPGCEFPGASFSTDNFSVSESSKTATITIELPQPAQGPGTVSYTLSAGTAAAGTDFTLRNGTVAFTAGQTTRTFTVSIRKDKVDEQDETINLALTGTTGSIGLGERTAATLTIEDDDATPTLRFSKTKVKARESAGSAAVTVSLSAASGRQVSVDITTQSGTAMDGLDYTGSETAGPFPTIVFQPGQRTQVIQIPIINDPDVEGPESFTAQLGNAVNAIIPANPPVATVNIISDDKAARRAVRSFIESEPVHRKKAARIASLIDEVLATDFT